MRLAFRLAMKIYSNNNKIEYDTKKNSNRFIVAVYTHDQQLLISYSMVKIDLGIIQ